MSLKSEQRRMETLRRIEGLQTIDMVVEKLGLTKQSVLNLLSKLKKQHYVTVSGGGKQKRFYKITLIKQLSRDPGMFDIINKYSPMKLDPWFDHQVHGPYGPEEALTDAIKTESFRVILASLNLFTHITNWKKLYKMAKEKDCWQKVAGLYEVARLFIKVRAMPSRYLHVQPKNWQALTQLRRLNFPLIAKRWKIYIPFNHKDMLEIT